MEINIANPIILLLISPIILLGFFAIRRGASKLLILSRIIVFSLLIIALAGPYSLATHTIRDENPKITLISDQTLSMDLFEKDVGQRLYDFFKTRTSLNLRQITGIRSPIGDEIIQSSQGNDNILLVSDGNNNYGKDLADAVNLVSHSGTKVFGIFLKPIRNDLSVEIVGPKNIIQSNENVFNIVVRQAGEQASYSLEVQVDGKTEKTETITQKERTQIIPFAYTFGTLGAHRITAQITPAGEDRNSQNNFFRKAVYVVPKPKILLVTSETDSPLNTIVTSLYQVTTVPDIGTDLSQYKAVIVDNKDAGSLSASTELLRRYLADGGGMAVVGGENAYDYGRYNNSPFEKLLPIISKAAQYKGGRNVVIVIDSSGSTRAGVYGEPITNEKGQIIGYTYENTVIGLIDANALGVVKYIDSGSSVGVVAYAGIYREQPLLSMASSANRKKVEDFISQIGPETVGETTQIELGLQAAGDMLKSVSGSKLVIILSDGQILEDGKILDAAKSLKNQGAEVIVGQISTNFNLKPEQKASEIQPNYDKLAKALGTQVIVYGPLDRVCDERKCLLEELGPTGTATPTPTPEITNQSSLAILDSNHFITKYLNITGDITGFNDVTPKLGSDRLVATSPKGKPILTVWNFGLGRVASLTTDDGYGGGKLWASVLYTGENSRLISSIINWAIGDPRPKEAVLIQSEDLWSGTSDKVTVTSEAPPRVLLEGKAIELTQTERNRYEGSITLEKEGFYDLSGYPIAVNYPLEYREIGFNEKLPEIIAANGGKMYDQDEATSLALIDIKEKAVRIVEEPISEKMPFLLAALGLFLGEVIVRRIRERYR